MSNAGNRFLIYNIPLRGEDTAPLYTNWQIAADLRQWLNAEKLCATWLLRYDVLADAAKTAFCQSLGPSHETGVWLEITASHAKAAGVPYRLAAGQEWWWAEHSLTIGYHQPERRRLLDTAMEAYFKVFRRYPAVVSMWMIDTFSVEYLAEKYGVKTFGLCRDQYGVDGYSMWGSWYWLPYWPARKYIWHPARTAAGRADYLVYPLVTCDILMNYAHEHRTWSTEPFMIQSGWFGMDMLERYINPLSRFSFAQGQPIGLTAFVSENGAQRWNLLRAAYRRQLRFLGDLCRRGAAACAGAGRYAQWYRRRYPRVSPGQVWFRAKAPGTLFPESACAMACMPSYRARLRADRDGFGLRLADLRVYDETAVDPYWKNVARGRYALWMIPFVIDGSRYHLGEQSERVLGDCTINEPMAFAITTRLKPEPPAGRRESLTQKNARVFSWREAAFTATWRFNDDAIIVRAAPRRADDGAALCLDCNPAVLPMLVQAGKRRRALPDLAGGWQGLRSLNILTTAQEAGGGAVRIQPLPCAPALAARWEPRPKGGRLWITHGQGRKLALKMTPLIAAREV